MASPTGIPHHKNAHGRDAWDWDLPEPPPAHALWRCRGGPTSAAAGPSAAGYVDTIDDYVGNEVTIDYNTGLVGASAFVVDALGR